VSQLSTSGLIVLARGLLERPDAATSGWWPRAAALLARQALEQALCDYWGQMEPGMTRASTRAQFLCLREYLKNDELVGSAHHTWQALSEACHHHPYQLSPTSKELCGWLSATEWIVEELEMGVG
jgi:hypothetical protein